MTNKLTSNSRATIPKKVREHLGIGPGSWVAYDIDANGDVRLRKSCRSAPLTVSDSRFAALRGTRMTGMSTDEIMKLLRD